MSAERPQARVILGISDDPATPLASDFWIGELVALGAKLRRYLPKLDRRQLVVAISVPCRDYVAALIATGWMLSSPAPVLGKPIEIFRAVERGTCLRAVTEKVVVTGRLSILDEDRTDPRVIIGGKNRLVDRYKAVAVLAGHCEDIETALPEPGFLGDLTRATDTWLERVASPPADLALVGVVRWLREDLESCIGNAIGGGVDGTPLANYVAPIGDRVATWATPLIPSARLGEDESLPLGCSAAILDRFGAIKYLNDIVVPIVVCVIDRSVADDSAAELVIQARLSNSRLISVRGDLGWTPPVGVEAVAFTVAL